MLNHHFVLVANVWYYAWRYNSDGVRDSVCYLVVLALFVIAFVNVTVFAVLTISVRSFNVLQYPEVNDFVLFSGRTDDRGIICDQRGIFRVNCMDCLDRTNVVQAALARHIMEQQVN